MHLAGSRCRSFLLHIAPLTLVLAVASAMAAQASAVEQAARALPLRQFAVSRATQTDHDGFYYMPTALGDDYFDGTSGVARVRRHFETARAVGAKYLRCAFSWNAIEKSPREYDWKFWNQLVEMSRKYYVGLIPYVAYTPAWAATSKEQFWKQPPRSPQLYAQFMQVIVVRYRGKITAWEIWNEPDLTEYWAGSAEQFAELVKQTAVAMRQADPDIVVVLGGMSWGPGDFFRQLISEYHVDHYVDVVAMHGYPESWLPQRAETVYHDRLEEMADILRKSGSGVQVWLNEMGYADYRYSDKLASVSGVQAQYSYEHTAQYAAAALLKAEIMTLASGAVALTGWYRIDDFPLSERRLGGDEVNYHLGLIDTAGHRKPAFAALKFFNKLFGRPTRVWQDPADTGSDRQAVVHVLEGRDSKLMIAGWLRSSEDAEVSDHSGRAVDSRRYSDPLGVPCRAVSHVRVYDEQGRRRKTRLTFSAGRLYGAALNGEHVFVAEMNCSRD